MRNLIKLSNYLIANTKPGAVAGKENVSEEVADAVVNDYFDAEVIEFLPQDKSIFGPLGDAGAVKIDGYEHNWIINNDEARRIAIAATTHNLTVNLHYFNPEWLNPDRVMRHMDTHTYMEDHFPDSGGVGATPEEIISSLKNAGYNDEDIIDSILPYTNREQLAREAVDDYGWAYFLGIPYTPSERGFKSGATGIIYFIIGEPKIGSKTEDILIRRYYLLKTADTILHADEESDIDKYREFFTRREPEPEIGTELWKKKKPVRKIPERIKNKLIRQIREDRRKSASEYPRKKRPVDKPRNGKCPLCGEHKPLEREHITPLSTGGKDEDKNVQYICHECQLKKHKGEFKNWGAEPLKLERKELGEAKFRENQSARGKRYHEKMKTTNPREYSRIQRERANKRWDKERAKKRTERNPENQRVPTSKDVVKQISNEILRKLPQQVLRGQ